MTLGDIWNALKNLFTTTLIEIESTPITLTNIVVGLVVVWISFLASRIVRGVMDKRVLPRLNLDVGLRYAFLQFLHYAVLIVGIYAGMTISGFPMGIFMGLFALLAVGIGFGMQNVASNFISGLILLLERPVQVGDRVAVGDLTGDVKKISLRITVVETMDRVSILVPNAQLLENEVTNWSYGDKRVRIHVPVGVAYGSDVDEVTRLLLEVAAGEGDVLTSPEPDVHFLEFADSSLNFELLCWVPDVAVVPTVRNRLNRAIDAAFREHGVEIPFPQRVVHMPARASA